MKKKEEPRPMRVQLQEIIHDLSGKPLTDPQDSGSPLTIGRACIGALLGASPRENPDGTEKFRRWQLAQKMSGQASVDLSIEEVALVKKLVGEAWTATVVGPVWIALEKAGT